MLLQVDNINVFYGGLSPGIQDPFMVDEGEIVAIKNGKTPCRERG